MSLDTTLHSDIEALRRNLSLLKSGDLAQRFPSHSATSSSGLGRDYNNALDALSQKFATLKAKTSAVQSQAQALAAASSTQSSYTDRQASCLEQTSATLEQLTEGVNATASLANRANGIVRDAEENASGSNAVVSRAIDAMGAIEGSSKKITKIIAVIDNISFQTNLLALNAGVEAARAGDAGRGFAVVASEVRALAQRSSEAAKEIKDLIATSSQQVLAGVELVGETQTALSDIVGSVSTVSGLVKEIAEATAEQSSHITDINSSVSEMDRSMREDIASKQERATASSELLREAESLAQTVASFKTREPRPQARPKAPIRPTPVERPKAPATSTTSSSAVAAEVFDDWTEF